MQYRKFGQTGWDVSEIGFGGWQLGGTWGNVDDSESIETLLYAFEQGINFVDTAMLYGAGRSETVIGNAMKQWSGEKIYVATKVPPSVWNQQEDMNAPMRGRYNAVYMRQEVEAALKRLNVECIDLLQLHGWYHRGAYELDWLEALNELKLEGKVQHIGVSLHDGRPDQGVAVAKLGLVDSIQVLYNVFEQEPEDELFSAAKATNTAIIGRVPLDSGALTGTWNVDTIKDWSEDDKRYQMYSKGDNFAKTLARIDAVKDATSPHFENLAEAALRFTLNNKSISAIIPGMRNKHEVDLNVIHSDGKKFPEELAQELKNHAWKHSFY